MKVEKRDGRIQDFQSSKVRGSMVFAGAAAQEADEVTAKIEKWAMETAKNGVIRTIDIRKKLLELLRPINPGAAAAYEAYKKPTP